MIFPSFKVFCSTIIATSSCVDTAFSGSQFRELFLPAKKGTVTSKLLSMVLLQVRWMKKGKRAVVRIRIREIAEQKGMSRTKLSRLSDTNYKTIDMIWKNPYK